MPSPQKRLEIILLAAISICYIVWRAAFIRNTSFIAIDGNRYFLMDDDAMENYVAANYNGILLYLRRKSPDVFWEKVYAP